MVEIGRRENRSQYNTSLAFLKPATSIHRVRCHGLLRIFVVVWILILGGVKATSNELAGSDLTPTATTADNPSVSGREGPTPSHSGNGDEANQGTVQEARMDADKTPEPSLGTQSIRESASQSSSSRRMDTMSAVDAAHPVVSMSFSSTSTCPYRTANYVTDILPQQCLKTSWTGVANYTTVGGAVETSATTVTSTGEGVQRTGMNTQSGADVEEPAVGSPQQSGELSPQAGSSGSPQKTSEAEAEAETDSPLDNAMFLSFEDWKKQNLEKMGQSPDNVGQGRGSADGRRRPTDINNALDTFGDEGEIHLDFGGFDIGRTGETASRWTARQDKKSREESGEKSADKSAPARPRNSDAGKTCKERFNYASLDCAATILKTNAKCKSPASVLVENKDSYMLNECSMDNKFLIVELCDDILVDTIVLANFEFFSSMFRTFRISVSDRYPVKLDRWKDLGTFEARNTREMQVFLIENPLIWARYLRVEFLSHFGNEFYCPVSLLRVHGTTMIEDVRHQEEAPKGDEDIEDEIAENVASEAPYTPVPTAQEQKPVSNQRVTETSQEKPPESTSLPPESSSSTTSIPGESVGSESPKDITTPSSTIGSIQSPAFIGPLPKGVLRESEADTSSASTRISASVVNGQDVPQEPSFENTTSATVATSTSEQASDPSVSSAASSPLPPSRSASGNPERKPAKPSSALSSPVTGASSKNHAPSPEPVRQVPNNVQPAPAAPTTQESFFKSMHKRLQSLEANATLSLQYIEEQSRILRDAFQKVEKRQMSKTETFLRHLNDTVMAELKVFGQQYDQLWQSTVIELETHREQYQREILAISTRLTIVADELVFQKRMAVVQSTLLLLCLGLVIFVRTGGGYLELPLVHQLLGTKSHNMLRLQFDSPPDSPSSKDNSPHRQGRVLQRQSRSRRDILRENDDTDVASSSPSPSPSLTKRLGIRRSQSPQSPPTLGFSPPTPSPTDGGDEAATGRLSAEPSPANPRRKNVRSRGSAVELVRQSRSGPATPSGTRETDPMEWAGSERRQLESRSSNLSFTMSGSRSSSSGGSIISDGDGSDPAEEQGQDRKSGLEDAVDMDGSDGAVNHEDTNGIVGTRRRNRAENGASWSSSENDMDRTI